MLDPRSIDTILYWLINNMNFNKIVFSNKIYEKLPTDFQYDVFYSKNTNNHNDNNLFIDFNNNKIVFKISKFKQETKLDFVSFFAFPSLYNSRYIINTNNIIYKKSINYYNPFSFKGRFRRYILKILLFFNLKKINIQIIYNKDIKSISNLLSNHFYTGVNDGKRTIVSMVFIGNEFKKFVKLAISKKNELKLINEYDFSKKIASLLANSPTLIPTINLVKSNFLSLDISSSTISRSYNEKKDLKKLFLFLISLQKDKKHKNFNEIINYNNITDHEISNILCKIGDKKCYVSIAHGDLSPWNFFISNKKLFVFDFESSKDNMPITFDFLIYVKSYNNIYDNSFIMAFENTVFNYLKFYGEADLSNETNIYVLFSLIVQFSILVEKKNNQFNDEILNLKYLIINYWSKIKNDEKN